MACDSLVLASRGEETLLLQTQEMQQFVLRPPASLVLVRFSPHVNSGRSGLVVSAVRASLSRFKEFPLLAYLPKPFPMEALLRLAEEAAQRRQGNTQGQGDVSAPTYPTRA